jgi:hypothetical protein
VEISMGADEQRLLAMALGVQRLAADKVAAAKGGASGGA